MHLQEGYTYRKDTVIGGIDTLTGGIHLQEAYRYRRCTLTGEILTGRIQE